LTEIRKIREEFAEVFKTPARADRLWPFQFRKSRLENEEPMASKCPITREQFAGSAKPLKVEINGQTFMAEVKQFSTGSFGWNINTKVTIEVGGQPVNVQVGLNMAVVGSKELPR
jgi:hypothetical protein